MSNLPSTLLADFYKLSHREQYPEKTEYVYSPLIPRSNKYFPQAKEIVVFGIQGFIKKYLIDHFNKHFFSKKKEEVISEYIRVVKHSLGIDNPETKHIEDLHDFGYLPISVKAIKEGSVVPIKTPIMTIVNTHREFFWLTNYLETISLTSLWQPITSATIAYEFKKIMDRYADKTVGNREHVPFQCHDFSMRGMSSLESAETSGAGHLTSFVGTDTIPAILYHEKYYNANVEKELVGTSIPATEHSVMSSYGTENEYDLFKRLMTEIYPSGLFSVVSDTWDFWKVIGEYLPKLKKEVLSRNGKVVIRPDSGDPVKILTGDPLGKTDLEKKGLIQALWDIFGGKVNDKGYKELDPHIGAIYGDSITIESATEILWNLEKAGFASSNIVFGIGGYTYQYNTRDTFGFAVKATYAVVDGEERFLFKDPKTDDGTKRSLRGLVHVSNTDYKVTDGLNDNQYSATKNNALNTVFENGELFRQCSLSDIRDRLNK